MIKEMCVFQASFYMKKVPNAWVSEREKKNKFTDPIDIEKLCRIIQW